MVPFMSVLLVSLIPIRGSGGIRGDDREAAGKLDAAPEDKADRGHLPRDRDPPADLGIGEHVADDLTHVLDEGERSAFVAPREPCGDLRAPPGHRDVDTALRRRAADEAARRRDALAEKPAHLIAGPGVDVAAQRMAATTLIDAEVLDRDPARPRPRGRPVNAIEHLQVPPRLSLERLPAPRCAAVSPGTADLAQTFPELETNA